MLTGAGLLTRSLRHVLEVQPGFAAQHLTAVRVDPRRDVDLAAKVAYFDAIVREVSALPGVQSVGLTDALPLGDNFGWRRWGISTAERPESDKPLTPLVRKVDEGYFAAMKIPLREGRPFDVADARGQPVMIVNEQLARTLWPGKDPIGREVKTSGVEFRVIGVVPDVHYFGLDREPDMEMYMPLRGGNFQSVDLVIRSPLPAATLAASVRAALHRVDPGMPVPAFRTMDELVDRSTFVRRFVVSLVGGFALFGLLLAALGIYGVISYAVLQRQQEIGIRMALGATPAVVRAGIMRQTGALVVIGALCGLPVAAFAGRAIRSLLYDVRSSDPMTFGAVAAVLGIVAVLAGYLPAFRASRVDPAVALRR
jgi:predicted permease